MNTSKKDYNYSYVSIYFDMDNPYQKECFEMLQKIKKKKSLFLGMLAHNFLKQFGEADISETDLKNYIKSYDIICKMESGQSNAFPAMEQTPSVEEINVHQENSNEYPKLAIPAENPSYNEEERKQLIASMNTFSY